MAKYLLKLNQKNHSRSKKIRNLSVIILTFALTIWLKVWKIMTREFKIFRIQFWALINQFWALINQFHIKGIC